MDGSDADGDFTGGGFLLPTVGKMNPTLGKHIFFKWVGEQTTNWLIFCLSVFLFYGASMVPSSVRLKRCLLDEQDLLPTKISSVPQEVRPICHRRRGKLGGGFKDAIGRAYF